MWCCSRPQECRIHTDPTQPDGCQLPGRCIRVIPGRGLYYCMYWWNSKAFLDFLDVLKCRSILSSVVVLYDQNPSITVNWYHMMSFLGQCPLFLKIRISIVMLYLRHSPLSFYIGISII